MLLEIVLRLDAFRENHDTVVGVFTVMPTVIGTAQKLQQSLVSGKLHRTDLLQGSLEPFKPVNVSGLIGRIFFSKPLHSLVDGFDARCRR